MMIIDADDRTTSRSECDHSRQCLVGITINAPFAEQNYRGVSLSVYAPRKTMDRPTGMTTTVVEQKGRKGIGRGASLHRKTQRLAARK